MELTIKGKNLELSNATQDYIRRKIGKLARYLDTMVVEGTVEVSNESTRDAGQRHVAQVTLTANGTILRAEERGADIRAAIDSVADTIERQMVRFKERVYFKAKTQAGRISAAEVITADIALGPGAVEEPESEEGEGPRIVRTKRFAIKPMPPEEATEQMELLGHDFFVFLNDDTDQVNVVYRRRDGNYGLIEPDLT